MDAEIESWSFLKNADQPSHSCHRIYLLRNLRHLKSAIAKKNLQVIESEILRELNDSDSRAIELDESNVQAQFDNSKTNSGQATVFLSTIELLGTLYDTTKDDAFFQQQERLVNVLDAMKQNELPDKEVELMKAEYKRLNDEKNELEQIFKS